MFLQQQSEKQESLEKARQKNEEDRSRKYEREVGRLKRELELERSRNSFDDYEEHRVHATYSRQLEKSKKENLKLMKNLSRFVDITFVISKIVCKFKNI